MQLPVVPDTKNGFNRMEAISFSAQTKLFFLSRGAENWLLNDVNHSPFQTISLEGDS